MLRAYFGRKDREPVSSSYNGNELQFAAGLTSPASWATWVINQNGHVFFETEKRYVGRIKDLLTPYGFVHITTKKIKPV